MAKTLAERLRSVGILPKLLISFLFISGVPLISLGYIANTNLNETGLLAVHRAEEMGERNLEAAEEIGKTAIGDSVQALDRKSTEAIELRTVELARKIADFLYERDKDLRVLAAFPPGPAGYLQVYRSSVRDVITAGDPARDAPAVVGANPENMQSWRHKPPFGFKKVSRPLYREITFIDLSGRERIKIKDGAVSQDLLDVSDREKTYCKAEDYFPRLGELKAGEIHVSRVIGAHVKGWLKRTSEGLVVTPESAFAGKENPHGGRFEGIIRWAMAVHDAKGEKIGYVTLALDHIHLMEMIDHVVPNEEMFSALSDAGSGNYAFIWDDRDRSICHPRQFFICGYDPETGKEVPGWVSEPTYREYLQSGLSLGEFVERLPPFRDFTQKKPGSLEQMKAGNISLDCRVLDTAPQCQGWHEGTEDGGSGSFLIFWSGWWKLTTYAAIPYYTGGYGASKRGFGYVTIGANVDEFHKAANITKANIEDAIRAQGRDIEATTIQTREMIGESSANNRRLVTVITLVSLAAVILVSTLISLGITKPLRRLTEGAVAMSRGELTQSIEVKSHDEVGRLAESFNEMATAVAEVDRMKSEFVTIASHELRTPIQAMLLGISGILEGYSGKIDDEAREDLLLARDGIERLTRLVQDLLDISRIEARRIEFNMTPASIADIVGKAVEEVGDLAARHGHTIEVKIPSDIPEIIADRDRIIQVVINLLSNSIKYTPDGGRIVIDATAESGRLNLGVADNGFGIPPWAREEVFKKFFQADSIMSQKVGGCGLGLTITRGIVEEHGGMVHCESPPPQSLYPDLPLGGERRGTVFFVNLPVGKVS
ncbi:MAG: HAMP domain-containing sensor histidine kinase [Syntrophobacteraceae bacterium]